MNPQDAIDLGREAIRACVMIGGPILVASLVIGLLLGIVQAMTQVQDQTVSFVPKLLVLMLGIGLALPWLSDQMIDFSRDVLGQPLLLSRFDAGGSSGNMDLVPPDDSSMESRPERVAARTTKSGSSPLFFIPASAQRNTAPLLESNEWPELDSGEDAQPATPRNPFQLPHFHYEVNDRGDLNG